MMARAELYVWPFSIALLFGLVAGMTLMGAP